ncbi:GntR family transcriptional regulator [Aeromicrobium sp. Leaf350]|uniref:GntR family transcriptional regulator n=1 Tax=Aeromicrobium sp. Leaf350 TaxID=2876565 RepID=UPI0021054813|nr:GntR family transcriptional regulator [Aeromicrobium sp. Leaf350]
MPSPQTPRTKRDDIVDALRHMIFSGDLKRGDRLRQDALADHFGTSITPVREALRVLESDGLAISEPHRGVRVAALDMARLEAIYVMRRLVESYAMQRASLRISELELRAAEDFINELENATAAGDAPGARRLNRAFHFYLYDRCGLPTLVDQITVLWNAFPWDLILSSPQRSSVSQREHREILRAMRSGDLEDVARTTEHHIAQGFAAATAPLGGSVTSDPFDLT